MSTTVHTHDAYACSHLGAALLAYDRWQASCEEHDRETTDAGRMIYTGRCQVASEIVLHATGRRPSQIREEALADGVTPHAVIAVYFT